MLWNPFFFNLHFLFFHALISNNVCEAKSLRKPHAHTAIQGKAQQLALVSLSSPASSDEHRAVVSVVNKRAQWRVGTFRPSITPGGHYWQTVL